MTGASFPLEVNAILPPAIARLKELAGNLRFSWHRPTRALFFSLDVELWKRVGGNLKLFLRCVDQATLDRAASDPEYLARYERVLAGFDGYCSDTTHGGAVHLDSGDLVAYFCAEFGFHESFPMYSGGLGILAGDHCKTASDLGLPFVAMGLLYRQGYFTQTLDADGYQIATYRDFEHDDLPVELVRGADGREVRVSCPLPKRSVELRIWRAAVGRVPVYLLDSNVDENSKQDREITHKLYGGDEQVRIQQELLLGVGGVKALRALGLAPAVWHINEGHAAFMVLELIREQMAAGLDFAGAREAAAAQCVFTTHTPVAAGHDVFSQELALTHLEPFLAELKVDAETLLALGRTPGGKQPGFNMTRLALNGSRHCNGVSRIHGAVSKRIVSDQWPDVPPQENPVGYVTNGVHVSTFLDQAWAEFFDVALGEHWRDRMTDPDFWRRLDEVADPVYWNKRQQIKAEMLGRLRERLQRESRRAGVGDAHFRRLTRFLNPENPEVLTIGFARRFATYKRAMLAFSDLAWFKEIVDGSTRPVVFVFAGKAHPADEPAKRVLREVKAMSSNPEFLGHVIFVEDYDMSLARTLVAGVDVWLNNPISTLEASGTSGIKAAINGTLNLSIQDGWWAEGCDGENGWGIIGSLAQDAGMRDRDDAQALYELLQDEVIPLYYARNGDGYSPEWVRRSKHSMSTIIPHFNMRRVLENYIAGIYRPAARQGRRLVAEHGAGARALAAWKATIAAAWPKVTLQRLSELPGRLPVGEHLRLRVGVDLAGLQPQDVNVEVVMTRVLPASPMEAPLYTSFGAAPVAGRESLRFTGETVPEGHVFALDATPPWSGQLALRIRVMPQHELLSHPHETGLLKWL
jgi:starch phosphorylase